MEISNKSNALTYYQNYGISKDILNKFRVKIKEKENGFSAAYKYSDDSFKMFYSYGNQKWSTNNKYKKNINSTPDVVFGYEQLPNDGEKVIITGGEKDVLTFASIAVPAICVRSEMANIQPELITELKARFDKVLICYDTDETGVKQSLKFSEKYDIINLTLPEDFEGKDISDFMATCGTKEKVYELIKSAISNHNDFTQRNYYSAKDIMNMKGIVFNQIIKGILPSTNIVGFIGGSEVGKGVLSLQFVICYVLGKPFLNFKIQGGKKVLYCSLEDNVSSIKERLTTMLTDFTKEEKDKTLANLYFQFNSGDIKTDITSHLKNHPDTGMVIVDPLGEFMPGIDFNSFGQTREGMQFLYQISQKYNLLSVYIHHVSKAAESSGRNDKKNAHGSVAIEAKSRVVYEIKKLNNEYNELSIVKGNDLSKEVKSPNCKKIISFDESRLWFEEIENEILKNSKNPGSKIIDWKLVFENKKEMTTKQLIGQLWELYQIKKRGAESILTDQLSEFRIKIGVYQNPTEKEEYEIDEEFNL